MVIILFICNLSVSFRFLADRKARRENIETAFTFSFVFNYIRAAIERKAKIEIKSKAGKSQEVSIAKIRIC
jgi:hypothetical protein